MYSIFVAKRKKIYSIILAVLAFIAYTILAAQPIPPETILSFNWLRTLNEENDEERSAGGSLIPFVLGNRFGYVDSRGTLHLNREREQTISLSPEFWAEYDSAPQELVIYNPRRGIEFVLDFPDSYPIFLDGRIFLISKDQTSLRELSREGDILWQYDFEAPLTSIDAAGTFVLTGTLDGVIDLLDRQGNPLFPSFAPGAARIPVILACRISSDGSKLAIISGIDNQRFLFLELFGSADYRVTYHESLPGSGFRREVQMAFIADDTKVVFEQEAGLGIYDVRSRSTITLSLPGRLLALDMEGRDGLFFYISTGRTSFHSTDYQTGLSTEQEEKRLVALKLPDMELVNVPFRSEASFLSRRGNELFIGGGNMLASFTLNKR